MAQTGVRACGAERSVGERCLRVLCGVAILAVIPLSAAHLYRGIRQLAVDSWPGALAGLVLGLLAADAITGIVHWACDTWGSRRTPWLGASLIRSFREHHRDPEAICRHDWIAINREPAIAAGLGFALLGLAPAGASQRPVAYAFSWALLSFAAIANQVHRWAHERRPPLPVRWLQRSGLLLSPGRHARHHRPPYAQAYCISSGWLNAPLDALAFWRGLERGIRSAARRARRPRQRHARTLHSSS